MSSISMIMNGCNLQIDSEDANPHTLNRWLTYNGGYVGQNLYIWGSVQKYGLVFQGKTQDPVEMKAAYDRGEAVVLNVNHGRHWVLMTGYNDTAFKVNDAGYQKDAYLITEVVNSGHYVKPENCQQVAFL